MGKFSDQHGTTPQIIWGNGTTIGSKSFALMAVAKFQRLHNSHNK